jgi:NarL family two-component system sensor histidine kinase LiaS
MMNEQRSGRSGQASLIAWLGASHILAAAGAAGAVLVAPAAWALPARLGAALVVGATLGLLLSQPLTGALQVTSAALAALARGQAIAPLPQDRLRRWGPLGALLGQVDALSARERELAALRADLVRSTGQAAVQAERNRLARDLHDSIKQQLYAINVSAAAALARWGSDLTGALVTSSFAPIAAARSRMPASP